MKAILHSLICLVASAGLSHALPFAFWKAAAGGASGFVAGTYGTVLAWYRAEDIAGADASSVSAWTDHGPGGKNLAQASAGLQPTKRTNIVNGYAVVRFDGADDYIATAATLGNCGTVIAVLGRITYTNANALISSNSTKRLVTFFPGATTIYSGDADEFWGASTATRINGVSTYTFPANPAFAVVAQSGTPTAFGAVAIGDANNDPLNGDVLEVVFYAETLSAGTQDAAAAALMTKYALP